jgi:uncharacterized protein YdeI (YjbR/CyaY-like superfamily)
VTEPLFFDSREGWRTWLEQHGSSEREVCTLRSKKRSRARATISYDEALEEALCFGWIDSLTRRVDDDYSSERWTPRRPGGNWSPWNRELVRRLLAEGHVVDAGRAVLPPDL